MADCITGLRFIAEGKANCANVKELCAYAGCSAPSGDQCYGIDGSEGQSAGVQPYGWDCDNYCPLAFDNWYPYDHGNTPMCCDEPEKIAACNPEGCGCHDLEEFRLSLSIPSSAPPTTSTTPSTSSPSPTNSSVTDTTMTPETRTLAAATDTTRPSSGGLSTGAKAGIGVGAVLGAAALFGLALWLGWILRKRRKSAVDLPTEETKAKHNSHNTLESSQAGYTSPGDPPRTTGNYELDGREVPVEAGH